MAAQIHPAQTGVPPLSKEQPAQESKITPIVIRVLPRSHSSPATLPKRETLPLFERIHLELAPLREREEAESMPTPSARSVVSVDAEAAEEMPIADFIALRLRMARHIDRFRSSKGLGTPYDLLLDVAKRRKKMGDLGISHNGIAHIVSTDFRAFSPCDIRHLFYGEGQRRVLASTDDVPHLRLEDTPFLCCGREALDEERKREKLIEYLNRALLDRLRGRKELFLLLATAADGPYRLTNELSIDIDREEICFSECSQLFQVANEIRHTFQRYKKMAKIFLWLNEFHSRKRLPAPIFEERREATSHPIHILNLRGRLERFTLERLVDSFERYSDYYEVRPTEAQITEIGERVQKKLNGIVLRAGNIIPGFLLRSVIIDSLVESRCTLYLPEWIANLAATYKGVFLFLGALNPHEPYNYYRVPPRYWDLLMLLLGERSLNL